MKKVNLIFILIFSSLFFISIVSSLNSLQKIETEFITFELPNYATHYWINDGLDKYEVIVHNFSIKDNEDYILKISWYDERYIDETLQIHYEFKDNILSEENIKLYSLSEYDKDCMNNIPTSLSATPYQNCKKGEDDSKLSFQGVEVEIGTLTGYNYEIEEIGGELINNSIPIYSWASYENIITKDIDESFVSIDDVNVSACGTLSAQNETYLLNISIVTAGDCFVIDNSSITLDFAGYNITGDVGAADSGVDINAKYNATIKNGYIYSFGNGIEIQGDSDDNNITNMTINSSLKGLYIHGCFAGDIDRNSFFDINIWNCSDSTSSGCISLSDTDSSNFTNIILSSSADSLIYSEACFGDGSDNNIFKDMKLTSSTDKDIEFKTADDNNLFLNVSYDTSKESIHATADLTRKWYFSPQVNYTNGTGIYQANVTAYNSSGHIQESELTDGTGGLSTNWELIEYVNLGGTRYYYTDYNFKAVKSGWITNSQTINLTTNYLNRAFNLKVSPYVSEICDTLQGGFALLGALFALIILAFVVLIVLNLLMNIGIDFKIMFTGGVLVLVVGGIVLGFTIVFLSELC